MICLLIWLSGLLLAITAAKIFHVALAWPLILWGIVFALVPDIDVIPDLSPAAGKLAARKSAGTASSRIPDCLHRPPFSFLFSPGPLWGYLFTLGAFLHLLHDSIGMGWGIQWLWPFNKTSTNSFRTKRTRSWRLIR